MIKKEIQEAIELERVPKDELDNLWEKLSGCLPTTMLFAGFGLGLLSKKTDQSVSLEHQLYSFLFATILFLYTLWCFMSEHKLKRVSTELSLLDNSRLVSATLKELGWRVSKKGVNHFISYIPFVLGSQGHKLI
jgi:hypothetical protein